MGKFRDSQTARNLLTAFAGDSQARNRCNWGEYFSGSGIDLARLLLVKRGNWNESAPPSPVHRPSAY